MKTARLRPPLRRMAGFTLVESVIVILITGILAAVVAIFIRAPVQGYFDTVRRAELTDQADLALRRITRDVRLALPNSVRLSTVGNVHYIEFIMTRSGGRYRDVSDGSTGGDFLSFSNAADLSFDVHGPLPAITPGLDFFVVFNLGPGNAPADLGGLGAPAATGDRGAERGRYPIVTREAAVTHKDGSTGRSARRRPDRGTGATDCRAPRSVDRTGRSGRRAGAPNPASDRVRSRELPRWRGPPQRPRSCS